MYKGDDIRRFQEERRNSILKSFDESEDSIEKARHGVYADNSQNRRLNRVGQQYGHKKQEEAPKGRQPKKQDDEPTSNSGVKTISDHARSASDEALERAAKSGNEEHRVAAKQELKRRETEGDETDNTKQESQPKKEQPKGKYNVEKLTELIEDFDQGDMDLSDFQSQVKELLGDKVDKKALRKELDAHFTSVNKKNYPNYVEDDDSKTLQNEDLDSIMEDIMTSYQADSDNKRTNNSSNAETPDSEIMNVIENEWSDSELAENYKNINNSDFTEKDKIAVRASMEKRGLLKKNDAKKDSPKKSSTLLDLAKKSSDFEKKYDTKKISKDFDKNLKDALESGGSYWSDAVTEAIDEHFGKNLTDVFLPGYSSIKEAEENGEYLDDEIWMKFAKRLPIEMKLDTLKTPARTGGYNEQSIKHYER